MSKLARLVMVLLASAFISGAAVAFEGVSIGAIGNMTTFDTNGFEQETTGDLEKTTHSVSKDKEFPSFFAEYTTPSMGNFGMTLGVEWIPGAAVLGAKSRTDTQNETEADSDDSGVYDCKAEVDNHIAIYFEPAVTINDTFGIYGKAGLARVTVNTLESIARGADSSTYGNEGVWGTMIGFGVKAQHSSGIFLKLEGITIDYETITLESQTGNKNKVEATPEQDSVRLAIGYNF